MIFHGFVCWIRKLEQQSKPKNVIFLSFFLSFFLSLCLSPFLSVFLYSSLLISFSFFHSLSLSPCFTSLGLSIYQSIYLSHTFWTSISHEILLKASADAMIEDEDGVSVLMSASSQGHTDVARFDSILLYSPLFHSILFHSILFHSTLFVSILF